MRHWPSSHMYISPDLQPVGELATVEPSIMQVRIGAGCTRGAATTSGWQATARSFQVPLSQRYCTPDWQLADPEEYDVPPKSQLFPESLSEHATESEAHCPSSQRNCVPA